MHLEIIQERLIHPVRWLTSRDSSRLNNLGIALMGIGATDAVTTGATKFTNELIPWWSIIVGLAMFTAGLILTGYTMGATESSTIELPSEDGQGAETRQLRNSGTTFNANTQLQAHSSSTIPADTQESNRDADHKVGISKVLPLPIAADFYSQIAPIIERFESLEEPPDPPRRVTGSSVFRWNIEMTTWIRHVEAVLDAAYDVAKTRGREGFPSVELAQKAADARAGLQKLRNLASQYLELSDWKFDPAIPQGIREDVASVVALAASS